MKSLAAIFALIFPTLTLAQYGYDYDPSSGNQYHTRKGYDGSTEVDGYNYNTGAMWNTTIDKDGDMRGYDSRGNSWDYDSSSETYYNYGTGVMCTGSGEYRICN